MMSGSWVKSLKFKNENIREAVKIFVDRIVRKETKFPQTQIFLFLYLCNLKVYKLMLFQSTSSPVDMTPQIHTNKKPGFF